MNSYDEEVKALQAEAMAALQRELVERPADLLRLERNTFITLLIQTRLKRGLSQAELASRLNMQQPAIARIESGRGNPSLNTLLAITKALESNLMLEYKQ